MSEGLIERSTTLACFRIVRWVYSSLPMSIYCRCCVYGDFGRWKKIKKEKVSFCILSAFGILCFFAVKVLR